MRTDGRARDGLRPIRFTRGFTKYSPGSVLVEMGDTKVLCTASLEMAVPPFLVGSGKGWLSAEYAMLPSSTALRKAREGRRGPIDGRTQEIQRLVGRALRAVVDLKQLGERTIWLDCDVIQADGGTRTTSINGAYVALVDCVRNALSGKLSRSLITANVAAISVGRVGGDTLVDLNYEEDTHADTDMNVVMTSRGQFVEIQGTAERTPFSDSDLGEMLAVARKAIAEVVEAQNRALREI
ncbi:MAG: ribonuclease PH [Planctomycetes bacterium]|nr:ribonuclease PH [Planctomycetota bacterium]MBI3843186.1 ribonuclease PH [Planctomycetota bacterium]